MWYAIESTDKIEIRIHELRIAHAKLGEYGILVSGGCMLESDDDDAVTMTFTSKEPVDFTPLRPEDEITVLPEEIEHPGEGHEYLFRGSYDDYTFNVQAAVFHRRGIHRLRGCGTVA